MPDAVEDWQKKLFEDMNVSEKYVATSNVVREQGNVNAIYFSCVERAIKALFLMNSGGTITVLAYIPYSGESYAQLSLSGALVFFLFGLILACIVVAYDFHWAQKKSLEFGHDIKDFFLKKIPFESIRRFKIEQEPDKYTKLITKLGWSSALCIGLGIISGLLGYFLS